MKALKEFFKALVVGGLMFLVPLVVIAVVLDHALRIAGMAARSIAEHAQLGDVLGTGGLTLVAVLLLVAVSLLAGLIARTKPGRGLSKWFEESLLGGLPQYQLVKSMAEGLARVEGEAGLKPVLASIEDGWQIGYLLEQLDHGWVAVFLPQAPTPMSGNVMYLPGERIRGLDMTMVQAMAIVKRMGLGSGDALRGVDLTIPAGA